MKKQRSLTILGLHSGASVVDHALRLSGNHVYHLGLGLVVNLLINLEMKENKHDLALYSHLGPVTH